MQFVSNRDIIVRSKKCGQSILFVKGIPTNCPKPMWDEVMEKGILPVDEVGAPVDPANNEVSVDVSTIKLAPEDGEERDEKILAVVKAIVKGNDAKNFTGGGRPTAKAVSNALGWQVDQKDVNAVWLANRQKLLAPDVSKEPVM